MVAFHSSALSQPSKGILVNYSYVNVASLEATTGTQCPNGDPSKDIKFKSGTKSENQSKHTIPPLLEQCM